MMITYKRRGIVGYGPRNRIGDLTTASCSPSTSPIGAEDTEARVGVPVLATDGEWKFLEEEKQSDGTSRPNTTIHCTTLNIRCRTIVTLDSIIWCFRIWLKLPERILGPSKTNDNVVLK